MVWTDIIILEFKMNSKNTKECLPYLNLHEMNGFASFTCDIHGGIQKFWDNTKNSIITYILDDDDGLW